ncbi:Bbp19 family protein [Curvivirga aplysinae]|uniref:Bbp19 family protein n=1 Tax=Curvivirga aplysinae TaxID=2529852 RepID=UPI0012BB8F97|nr:hypothetical protein [Curvivirga aplysinae]MTI10735.1 hypothetical protein [Curvivirga aplysinae]
MTPDQQNIDWLWDAVHPTTLSENTIDSPLTDNIEEDHAFRINQAYLRCFNSPEGKIVLSHMRQTTLERALGPDSTQDALRQLEGQRQLVLRIERIIKQATTHPA